MPEQAKGSKSQVRMYYESVMGTPPIGGSNGVRLPIVDISIGLTQAVVASRVLQDNRSAAMPIRDSRAVGGSMTWQPDVRSAGWILYQLLGGYAVAGPVGGLYTHTFTLGSLPPGVTLEKLFTDLGLAFQYYGCRFNTLNWDIGTGGVQEASIDVIGTDEGNTAVIDAAPLTHPFVGFRVPSVTLAQAGITTTTATRFGMNLANNLEPSRVIGNGGLINGAPEGTFGSTGTLETQFRSLTDYNKARNSTEESIIVTYPAVQAGMSLQWLFDEVQYNVAPIPIAGPGGVTVPLAWTAYYDDAAAGSAVRAIIINDVATYAAIP